MLQSLCLILPQDAASLELIRNEAEHEAVSLILRNLDNLVILKLILKISYLILILNKPKIVNFQATLEADSWRVTLF